MNADDERRKREARLIQEREQERRMWEARNKTKNGPKSMKAYKTVANRARRYQDSGKK